MNVSYQFGSASAWTHVPLPTGRNTYSMDHSPESLSGRAGALSRRQFIRVAGGIAGSAIALPLLLEACGGTAATGSTAAGGAPASATGGSASGGAKIASGFPTFVPAANTPKPDFPSVGPLYEDAYINYPANPFKSISAPPGKGSNVNILSIGLNPPPAPFDQNPAWKEVNKQLNANVQFQIVAPPDFDTRMATVMAGGDLPDMMFMYAKPGSPSSIGAFPGGPQFVQAACADLTQFLAGDAARDYPYLAAIPTFAYKNSGSVYQNKLYMVPVQRFPEGFWFFKNDNFYDAEIGKDYTPKNADDLKRVMQQLNKPKEGRYATASAQGGDMGVVYYSALFGAPNNWRLESSGNLTKAWETPEYKEALGFVRDLFAAGLFHPKSTEYSNGTVARNDFVTGKWSIWLDGFGNAWADFWRRGLQQNGYNYNIIPPFSAHDGAKPTHFFTGGFLGATALKKASPDRVKELLGILNYLAAPFGSQEDLLLTSGVKDIDYTLDAKGNPILTKQGNPDANYVPWKYVVQHPAVIYVPDIPGFAKAHSDAEKALIPIGVADPTYGLVSNTQLTKGIVLDKGVRDGVTDIVVGRRPLTDFDQILKTYLSGGGEAIRKEYADAIAASK